MKTKEARKDTEEITPIIKPDDRIVGIYKPKKQGNGH